MSWTRTSCPTSFLAALPRLHDWEKGHLSFPILWTASPQSHEIVEPYFFRVSFFSPPPRDSLSECLRMPHLHEPSPCARHCFAHAQAIALHMRKPLLCTCAPHCFAHARPIIPRTSTIRKHASRRAPTPSLSRSSSFNFPNSLVPHVASCI